MAGGNGAAWIIPFQQMISTRSRAMGAASRPSGASSQTMQSMESDPATVKGAGLPNFDEPTSTVTEPAKHIIARANSASFSRHHSRRASASVSRIGTRSPDLYTGKGVSRSSPAEARVLY